MPKTARIVSEDGTHGGKLEPCGPSGLLWQWVCKCGVGAPEGTQRRAAERQLVEHLREHEEGGDDA